MSENSTQATLPPPSSSYLSLPPVSSDTGIRSDSYSNLPDSTSLTFHPSANPTPELFSPWSDPELIHNPHSSNSSIVPLPAFSSLTPTISSVEPPPSPENPKETPITSDRHPQLGHSSMDSDVNYIALPPNPPLSVDVHNSPSLLPQSTPSLTGQSESPLIRQHLLTPSLTPVHLSNSQPFKFTRGVYPLFPATRSHSPVIPSQMNSNMQIPLNQLTNSPSSRTKINNKSLNDQIVNVPLFNSSLLSTRRFQNSQPLNKAREAFNPSQSNRPLNSARSNEPQAQAFWTHNKHAQVKHFNDIELEFDPEANIDGEISKSSKRKRMDQENQTGEEKEKELSERKSINNNEKEENNENHRENGEKLNEDGRFDSLSDECPLPRAMSDLERELDQSGHWSLEEIRRQFRSTQLFHRPSVHQETMKSHSSIYQMFHQHADKLRQTIQDLPAKINRNKNENKDKQSNNRQTSANGGNRRALSTNEGNSSLAPSSAQRTIFSGFLSGSNPISFRGIGPLAELSSIAKRLRVEATSKFDDHAIEADIEAMDLIEAKQLFLKVLGKGLFSCGLPMHVVEFYVILAGQRLGIHVVLASINTTMFISFGGDTHCHLVRPDHPSLSLSKMVDICEVAESIVIGANSYEDSMSSIQKIVGRAPLYPDWTFYPSMFLMSFTGAPLFAGGWKDCFVAGVCSVALGGLDKFSATHRSFARGQDLLSGFLSAFIVVFCKAFISKEINALASTFAGIFWILPGLRAVLAMIDLSTGNPVTGCAKFFSTILTCLNLGIGIAVGMQFYQLFVGESIDIFKQPQYEFPDWLIILAVLFCSAPMIILLDGKRSHWPQLIAGSLVSYVTSSYASIYIDSSLGTWLAAFIIGVLSNLYGRFTPNPAVELFLNSILMLVPGSIGVKSILANDTLSSVEFFFKMISVAISIVTGLFSSNIVIPPLRSM
jgi:uncharacterized membrane protein YjjP (DUF1212 family)